jgi:hypothetical protein
MCLYFLSSDYFFMGEWEQKVSKLFLEWVKKVGVNEVASYAGAGHTAFDYWPGISHPPKHS